MPIFNIILVSIFALEIVEKKKKENKKYKIYFHCENEGELTFPKGERVILNINEFSGSNSESL